MRKMRGSTYFMIVSALFILVFCANAEASVIVKDHITGQEVEYAICDKELPDFHRLEPLPKSGMFIVHVGGYPTGVVTCYKTHEEYRAEALASQRKAEADRQRAEQEAIKNAKEEQEKADALLAKAAAEEAEARAEEARFAVVVERSKEINRQVIACVEGSTNKLYRITSVHLKGLGNSMYDGTVQFNILGKSAVSDEYLIRSRRTIQCTINLNKG